MRAVRVGRRVAAKAQAGCRRDLGDHAETAFSVSACVSCPGKSRRHLPSVAYSFTEFSRSALAMTLTELSAIAAAASIGESSQPVSG